MSREAAFIEALKAMAFDPAARGLEDDCAVLEFGGECLILTHDMLAEGTHFLPNADPADVAWKLAATNLSDLAAKGAEPIGVLLGAMLAQTAEEDERFVMGLGDALAHFGVPLLGGDTVSGKGPRSFGMTAIGRATHTPVPARSGATMGDGLFITGKLGAAMMGFEAERDQTGADSTAYRRPMARLAEGQALAPQVTAMMDISDGLLLDAFRMAQASQVSIGIGTASVPIDAPESRRFDALKWGDDYELLFTLPSGAQPAVPATRIGTIEPLGFVPLFLDGEPVANPDGLGFQH